MAQHSMTQRNTASGSVGPTNMHAKLLCSLSAYHLSELATPAYEVRSFLLLDTFDSLEAPLQHMQWDV